MTNHRVYGWYELNTGITGITAIANKKRILVKTMAIVIAW
jgi:hypothetical protein